MDLYAHMMMSLSSFAISILSRVWTVNKSMSLQPHKPYQPSLTIRLLWAFSFHGWGKVWTSEKQLRRLSTAAVLAYASANSTAYTDFPQNQSESQKNPQSAACLLNLSERQQTSIPCPSPRAASCKAARQRVHPELITFESGSECLLRLSQAGKGKVMTLWFCCFSSLHSGQGRKSSTHTHMHKLRQPVAMTKQRQLFPVWLIMNRCSASSPCSSSTASY